MSDPGNDDVSKVRRFDHPGEAVIKLDQFPRAAKLILAPRRRSRPFLGPAPVSAIS